MGKVISYIIVALFFVYYIFGDSEAITRNGVIKTVIIFGVMALLIEIGHRIYNRVQISRGNN